MEVQAQQRTMSPDALVADAERRICAVIADPATSYWLRGALRAAIARDPVDAVNDAALLMAMLQPWATAILDAHTARTAEPDLPFATGDDTE